MGTQVNAKIKDLFPNMCIPVIMVSAKSTEEDIIKGLDSGSTDYIKKPFQCGELLARVEAQLQVKVRAQGLWQLVLHMRGPLGFTGLPGTFYFLCLSWLNPT